MAIDLKDKENVNAPDSDYPYGEIRDDSGGGDGTPVNTEVYGDFHQFFARMFAVSGLTYNGLPDNAYSGFQYFDAFVKVIGDRLKVSNTIFVSDRYGNDSTGKIERLDLPFKTTSAATIALATFGTAPSATNRIKICVAPGNYGGNSNYILLKDYVDWELNNCIINTNGTTPTIYDDGISVDSVVYGVGQAEVTKTNGSGHTVHLTGVTTAGTRRVKLLNLKINSTVDKTIVIASAYPVTINCEMYGSDDRVIEITHNLSVYDYIYGNVYSTAANVSNEVAVYLNTASVFFFANITADNNSCLYALNIAVTNCRLETKLTACSAILISTGGFVRLTNVLMKTISGNKCMKTLGGTGGVAYVQGTSAANEAQDSGAASVTITGGTLVVDSNFS